MKVLMENKKKQVGYFILIVGCLGIMVWIWIPRLTGKAADNLPPVDTSVGINDPAGLLPFGESFNASVMQDQRFMKLEPFNPLTVSTAELGRNNPFITPQPDEIYINPALATTTPGL